MSSLSIAWSDVAVTPFTRVTSPSSHSSRSTVWTPWLMSAAPPSSARRAAPARAGVVLGRPVPLDAGGGEQHLPEPAPGDEIPQPHEIGLQPVLEQHAERDAGAVGGGHQGLALLERHVDRLLDEHVQRALGRGDAFLGVERRGRADHHEVHRAVAQKLLVALVGAAAVARGHRGGLGRVPALEGGDPEPRLARRADVGVGDVAAADEARLQRHATSRTPRPPARRARARRGPAAPRACAETSWSPRPRACSSAFPCRC